MANARTNLAVVSDNKSIVRTVTVDQVRSWVEACAPRAEPNVLVTPAIAAMLLEYNAPGESNRRMRPRHVANQAEAMRKRTWENTGEPIIVSDERVLNDGQHRLQAVVDAKVAVSMDLRFGVSRHAFGTTNAGFKRTAGDALGIMQIAQPNKAAAIARLVVAYERGLPSAAHGGLPNGDIVAAVERWPDLVESMRFTSALNQPFVSSPIGCVAFFASRTANDGVVETFFDVLRTGEGKASDPAHRWREYIIRTGGSKETGARVRMLANGIIAWNQFNRPLRKDEALTWTGGRAFPVVEGLKL